MILFFCRFVKALGESSGNLTCLLKFCLIFSRSCQSSTQQCSRQTDRTETDGNTAQRASGDFARNLHTSDTKQTLIFHKNAREYIKYSLRFLFHLTKNLTTHLSHNLCAVLPDIFCGEMGRPISHTFPAIRPLSRRNRQKFFYILLFFKNSLSKRLYTG